MAWFRSIAGSPLSTLGARHVPVAEPTALSMTELATWAGLAIG
jgi:hypothetical protein